MRKNIFAASAMVALMSQTAMACGWCPCFGGKEEDPEKTLQNVSVSGVESVNPISEIGREEGKSGEGKYDTTNPLLNAHLVPQLTAKRLSEMPRSITKVTEGSNEGGSAFGSPDRSQISKNSFSGISAQNTDRGLDELQLAIINSGLPQEIQEEKLDITSFSNFFYAFGRGGYDDLNLPFSIGLFMTEEEGGLYLLHKTQQGLVKAFDQAYSLKDNGVSVSICEYMGQGKSGSVFGGGADFSDNKVRERVLKALSSYSIFGDSQEVSEAVGTSSGGSSRRGSSVSSRSSVAQAKPLIEQERIDGLNSYVESLVGDQEAGRVLYQEFRGSLLTHVFEKREEGYPVQYIVELMRSESEKRHILESVASVLENPISAGLFLEVLFPITDQDEALNLLLRISGFGLEYSRSAGLKYAFGDQKEKLTLPRSVGVLRTDKTIHVMSLESRSAFFKSSK